MSTIGGPNIIEDGLVMYLDAANTKSYPDTGTTWYDLSGNDNHGEVLNGEYYDGYLRNSGNTSNFFCVNIPNSTSLNSAFTTTTGGWTIEEIIWTNSTNYPEADAGSVISTNGYNTGYGFDWNHGTDISTFRFEQIGGGTADTPTISISSPYNSYNTWRIRTMIWNRATNTNSLYINGVFINSVGTPNTTGQVIYDGGGISLGTLYGWKHYGRRAGLKIYNKVLTSTEILQNFNALKGRFNI